MGETTAKIASGISTVSSGGFGVMLLKWLFDCLQAGHLIRPNDELTIVLGTVLTALYLTAFHVIKSLLEKKTQVDLDGDGVVNGTAPAPAGPTFPTPG